MEEVVMIKSSIVFVSFCILVLFVPFLGAQISDPAGDVTLPAVDYVAHYFEQQGESLYVAITFDGEIANRDPGYSTNTFFTDTDFDAATGQPSSRVGSENNLTFTDIGQGHWFMRMWVLWDHDPAFNAFSFNALAPVEISPDGKTMSFKFSLVGLNWEEIQYDLAGWYKEGNSWHDVPHLPGDEITDVGLYSIDNGLVTQLVTKEGTKCTIEVPEPYSSTADAKNITGLVDEMVTTVQNTIGTISDASKKYTVTYQVFEDNANPHPYSTTRPNLYTTRIPGSGWVDEPDWTAMLFGLENMTLMELHEGARQILLTNHAYQRPVPGSGDGWYSTHGDSSNGFQWNDFHKHAFRALLGRAYEKCLTFHLAEQMSDSDAKTAILAARTAAEDAWAGFSGAARDLTPDIMAGFLIDYNDDLAWTEKVYKELLPATIDMDDTTDGMTQIMNKYINSPDFSISNSQDFGTFAHLGWYKTIASIQVAVLNLATGGNLLKGSMFNALQAAVPDFPLDQSIFNDAILQLKGTDEFYTIDDTVPFVWNSIKDMGTVIPADSFGAPWRPVGDTDDGGAGPIYMGMNFDFYGNTFDSIYVGVNGQLSFTDRIDWITNGGYGTTIPGMGWNNILCPLACDVMLADAYPDPPYNTATGTIYYYHDTGANTFTIEYYHITNHYYVVDNACVDTTLTFQVVLNGNDNSVTYYYQDLGIDSDDNAAKRATIGIQPSRDGILGVQYYGGNLPIDGYPTNQTAIKFNPKGVTAIDHNYSEQIVKNYVLRQNFPNPFNPTTTIAFELPESQNLTLKIYNVVGEEVKTLISGKFAAGYHEVLWDGTDISNRKLASGIYFYSLKTDKFVQTKKMVLIK
jgi:hypothetical protein